MNVFYDLTAWLYLSVCLTAAYGAQLFTCRAIWAWKNSKKAEYGPMFIYMSLLFYGVLFDHGVGLYCRVLRFADREGYDIFMSTPAWAIRVVLFELCLLAIVTHMTLRLRGVIRK